MNQPGPHHPPQSPSESTPSLITDTEETTTNTAALLLPHLAFFDPPILQILRNHYAQYGDIAHWAPVKGFGRVIIVWNEVESAKNALVKGDYLRLDGIMTDQGQNRDEDVSMDMGTTDSEVPEGYFRNTKNQSVPALRLFALPHTPLNPDPTTTHLAVPESTKNFLISPPGSPPEGWEPIKEDGPNTTTLAQDLQKALEKLMINPTTTGRRGSREVILDLGGVRVEVEDTSVDEHIEEVEERVEGGRGLWEVPGQNGHDGAGILPQFDLGGVTPSGRVRIAPTARPPM